MVKKAKVSSLLAVSALLVLAVTSCYPAEEGHSPTNDEVSEVEVLPESVIEVDEPYEPPATWNPTKDAYSVIDSECGTDLFSTAKFVEVGSGDTANTSVDASFIGVRSDGDKAKTECILRVTESPLTWSDLQAEILIAESETWYTDDGVWAGAGNVQTSAEGGLITLFLKFIGSAH